MMMTNKNALLPYKLLKTSLPHQQLSAGIKRAYRRKLQARDGYLSEVRGQLVILSDNKTMVPRETIKQLSYNCIIINNNYYYYYYA